MYFFKSAPFCSFLCTCYLVSLCRGHISHYLCSKKALYLNFTEKIMFLTALTPFLSQKIIDFLFFVYFSFVFVDVHILDDEI